VVCANRSTNECICMMHVCFCGIGSFTMVPCCDVTNQFLDQNGYKVGASKFVSLSRKCLAWHDGFDDVYMERLMASVNQPK